MIDNSDPTEGVVNNNPSFRPKNYSNVPPPAGLDSSGGRGKGTRGGNRGNGRARGRGRGNGEAATT
jgi:5'-3' exoribonuclease 1